MFPVRAVADPIDCNALTTFTADFRWRTTPHRVSSPIEFGVTVRVVGLPPRLRPLERHLIRVEDLTGAVPDRSSRPGSGGRPDSRRACGDSTG